MVFLKVGQGFELLIEGQGDRGHDHQCCASALPGIQPRGQLGHDAFSRASRQHYQQGGARFCKKAGLRGDLPGLRLIVLEAARAQRVEQAIPEGGPVVAPSVQEVDLRGVLKPVGVPVGGHQFKLAGPVSILGTQVVERAPRAQALSIAA
jgi:hypothetical protein